jgi:galacturan 1,4-alpha-galacturonidase
MSLLVTAIKALCPILDLSSVAKVPSLPRQTHHLANMWTRSISFLAVTALLQIVAASPESLPSRPEIHVGPYNVAKAMPPSPPRDTGRYCYVKPSCKGDDASRIFKAFKDCNNGGTVVLDKKYWVSSPLDLTFLAHVDVVITGEVNFRSDPYYWADNSFKLPFQNMSTFWLWGGEDVNIYGDLSNDKSVLQGHGEEYWKEAQVNKTIFRPILFTFEGMKGATMSNLRMRNSPNWFNIVANSSDIVISDMDLVAKSDNGVKIANSDGWDTYRSKRVVIQNSIIDNTDGNLRSLLVRARAN